ncbi:MAG: hypothetical protein R3286_17100 [Gammaproteobacteria bacterium]|nr:hypothetical protein [Gammaproteobacteria bacterium]
MTPQPGRVRDLLPRALPAAVLIAALALPAAVSATTHDTDFEGLILGQFEIYDPEYRVHHEHYGKRLAELAAALANAQARGLNLHCSQQMFLEAKWLHRYTAHWGRLEDKLQRIEQSLDETDQSFAAEQRPVDGYWGPCYEELFMRLSATIDGIADLNAIGEQPRYRIRATGRLNTGKELLRYLQDMLVSDIANTGIDHRGELSSLITTYAQGAFKPGFKELLEGSVDLRSSSTLDALKEAFRFFLSGAQDPETGYWGAWYLVQGKVYKSADLSMTYHVVAYTRGRVERWPKIIETTMHIEAHPYPYGWRHHGRYNNHNLYDVARIYRFGWPHMTEVQREAVSRQLEAMLEWSLENTLGPDGTFIVDPTFSDSLADEYYFGVSFLDAAGYWRPEERFWKGGRIDADAAARCCHLKRRLEALDLEGWAAEGAMRKLRRNCGSC